MKRICKECGCEFDDYSYLKCQDSPKICDDCRTWLNIAAEQDDYTIFTKYLEERKCNK